jgi:peroxiredoxin
MSSLRRRAAALAAAALCAPLLAACSGGSDAVDQEAAGQYRFVAGDGTGRVIDPSERRSAPRFGGDLVGGGHLDSGSLRGKVVVVNFWGQWCAPCRVETPDFEKVYRATKDRGVEFLGVNVKDSEQLAKAFLDDKHVTYPSLYDPSGRVALAFRDYPPNAIPSTIVIDRRGRVAAVYLRPLLAQDIEPVVTRLAEER